MRTALLIAAIGLMLSGCATQQSEASANLHTYIARSKPQAESGSMKWSDYYSGAYNLAMVAGLPGDQLTRLNEMIRNAEQFESGAITKSEFEYRQRAVRAQAVSAGQWRAEEQRRLQAANAAAALQFMQASQPRPLTITPMAPLQTSATQPLGQSVTAFWTGQQRQVQTVTYQVGWSCEYSYAGRTFWRTFVTSCPSAVQVQ